MFKGALDAAKHWIVVVVLLCGVSVVTVSTTLALGQHILVPREKDRWPPVISLSLEQHGCDGADALVVGTLNKRNRKLESVTVRVDYDGIMRSTTYLNENLGRNDQNVSRPEGVQYIGAPDRPWRIHNACGRDVWIYTEHRSMFYLWTVVTNSGPYIMEDT